MKKEICKFNWSLWIISMLISCSAILTGEFFKLPLWLSVSWGVVLGVVKESCHFAMTDDFRWESLLYSSTGIFLSLFMISLKQLI